jgi:hypothetical protein
MKITAFYERLSSGDEDYYDKPKAEPKIAAQKAAGLPIAANQ